MKRTTDHIHMVWHSFECTLAMAAIDQTSPVLVCECNSPRPDWSGHGTTRVKALLSSHIHDQSFPWKRILEDTECTYDTFEDSSKGMSAPSYVTINIFLWIVLKVMLWFSRYHQNSKVFWVKNRLVHVLTNPLHLIHYEIEIWKMQQTCKYNYVNM